MKKELIEKITSRCLGKIAKEHIKQILSEELPDFQRIDEERMGKILNNIVGSSIYYDQLLQKSVTLEAVRIYNSTLSKAPAQPPALKPLPKEMPEDVFKQLDSHKIFVESEYKWHWHFTDLNWLWSVFTKTYGTPANNLQPLPKEVPDWFLKHRMLHTERQVIWDEIASTYGTPAKPNLPTVEELMDEMLVVYKRYGNDLRSVVEHLHDKYSLHPREWWQDLKEGDKFMYNMDVVIYHNTNIYLYGKNGVVYNIIECTPYTPPSAQDIIAKHNISEEEVKAIREGK